MGRIERGNFISLKITLFTNYLTVITNVLRLEVGERTGHDWSGHSGASPKTRWQLSDVGVGRRGEPQEPQCRGCLWEGKGVRLTQAAVIGLLSSRSVVFKSLNITPITPKSRGTFPVEVGRRSRERPLGLPPAHVQP